jgi:hypothetical protein
MSKSLLELTLKWSCDAVQVFGATLCHKTVILYHKWMNERYSYEFTINKVRKIHKTVDKL